MTRFWTIALAGVLGAAAGAENFYGDKGFVIPAPGNVDPGISTMRAIPGFPNNYFQTPDGRIYIREGNKVRLAPIAVPATAWVSRIESLVEELGENPGVGRSLTWQAEMKSAIARLKKQVRGGCLAEPLDGTPHAAPRSPASSSKSGLFKFISR